MRPVFPQWFVYLAMIATAAAASQAQALPPVAPKSLATVQSVKVTSNPAGITVEVEASQPLTPRSQLITDPDRLILDFPNSQPVEGLRSKLLNQGDIKGFRVARFSANPPTTRVVIDLNRPQHYQIFPDGKTVIVKLMSDQQQAAASAHVDNVSFTPPPPPAPKMEVEYKNGRLSISAERASLADILNEIHRQTGTDITVPPGAAQEPIVASIGPLPIREAMLSLLNGSRYNFILLDSEREPGKLKSVTLTYRSSSGISQPAIATQEPPVTQSEPEPDPNVPQTSMPPVPQPENEGQQDAPPPQDTPPQRM